MIILHVLIVPEQASVPRKSVALSTHGDRASQRRCKVVDDQYQAEDDRCSLAASAESDEFENRYPGKGQCLLKSAL